LEGGGRWGVGGWVGWEERKGMEDKFKLLQDYARLEDAVAAVEALTRNCTRDEELRIEFVRSQQLQPLKRVRILWS